MHIICVRYYDYSQLSLPIVRVMLYGFLRHSVVQTMCDLQDELRTPWYSVSHDLHYVLFKYDIRQVCLFGTAAM